MPGMGISIMEKAYSNVWYNRERRRDSGGWKDRRKATENSVVWKPTDRPRWDYPYFSLPNAFNLLYFIRADPFDRIFISERNA